MSLRIHNEDQLSLRGSTRAPASLKPLHACRRGRVCEDEKCETVLSQYNEGDRCWQHEPARPFQVRVRPVGPFSPAA
jgi:hypothetical protein